MEERLAPKLVSSSPEVQWVARPIGAEADAASALKIEGTITDNYKGFGGCFNELGWKALGHLSDNARKDVLAALFSSSGCDFNYCRMPIGANDLRRELVQS